MNNKLFKWLAVSLLLSVSVFCFIYLTRTAKLNGGQAAANEEYIPTEKEVITPVINEKPIFYSSLPREAAVINGYAVAHVGGSGKDTLKSVRSVGKNTVLFFDTESKGYDIKSEKASVAAAILDEKLTLLKTVTLTGQSAENFAAVKQTTDGFFIVTAAADYACVYRLDFNLITLGKLTLESSVGYSLYTTGDKLYLMAEKPDKLQIKVLTHNLEMLKTATAYIDGAHVRSVFPSADGALDIFADTADGYALLRYSEDGGFKSVNEVNDCKLLSVLPYSDDGALKFVGLRRSGENAAIFTANADFTILSERPTTYAGLAELFITDGNFSVYGVNDGEATVTVFCKHLDRIIEKDAPLFTGFSYRNYSDDIKVVGYLDNELTYCSFDGLSFTVIDKYIGADGYCAPLYDGSFALTSAHKSGEYRDNFGNNDVFVLKNLGA